MITIISPTTTMDFNKKIDLNESSVPYFINESNYLMNILKTLNINEVKNLMNLSDDLANLNMDRYKNFGLESNQKSQSILAFDGEVFNCMNVSDFNKDDFEFVNNHFRILSGLYGVLSPFDLIQPYRLEMKSKLAHDDWSNLYKFWKDKITDFLKNQIKNHDNKVIINLASSEYVKAINLKSLNAACNFINIEFKDYNEKTNKFRVIGMYSKQARGHMSRFIVKNKIDSIDKLKDFNANGYKYNEELSDSSNLIFTR